MLLQKNFSPHCESEEYVLSFVSHAPFVAPSRSARYFVLTKSEDLRGQGSKLSVVIKIDPCVAWHAQLKYAAAYHNYKLKCRSKVPPDNYKKFSMLSSS